MANLIQDFKDNCSNFLYIFIPDKAVPYFQQNGGSIILQKRQNQIAYVTRAAQMSKYSYQELYNAIGDEIVRVYGKTPEQIIIDVANGKNVYSIEQVRRNRVSGICGIGAIDSSTGYPVGAKKDNYATVLNTEGGYPIGRFNLETGEQVSYYDKKTAQWVAGATPDDDKDSRNMWANNIEWNNIIMKILNIIGFIFGVKYAKNLASYQSDGWAGINQNTAQNSTNNILPILLLGISGYMLVTNDK